MTKKKKGKKCIGKSITKKQAQPIVTKEFSEKRSMDIANNIKKSIKSYEGKDNALRRKHKKLLYGNALRHLDGKTLKDVFREDIEGSSSISDFYRGIQDAETEFELLIPVGTEYSSSILRELRKAKNKGVDMQDVWREATQTESSKNKITGKVIEQIINTKCSSDERGSSNESKGAVLARKLIETCKPEKVRKTVEMLNGDRVKEYVELSKKDKHIYLKELNKYIENK